MMRTTLSFLALAASVSGASISIDVGEDGAVKFDPETVTAAVGDTLEFHFYSGSGGHSVVSSTFTSPCEPATDAFFSGYIPGNDSGDQTFVVNVTSTDPIWFYCSLASHCQDGMVGVVNPPSGQTASDYAAAAAKVLPASAPASPTGGVLTTMSSSPSTMSSSPSSSSSAAESSNTIGRQTSGAASTANSAAATASGATNTVGRQSSAGTATQTSEAVGSNTASRQAGSSTSASASAATTSASAGVGRREGSDVGAVLGLAVFAGGLVALMA